MCVPHQQAWTSFSTVVGGLVLTSARYRHFAIEVGGACGALPVVVVSFSSLNEYGVQSSRSILKFKGWVTPSEFYAIEG